MTTPWSTILPKWVHVTLGDGAPLTLQSNRALRPSITSRTSSLRVKRGSKDGRTLSLAHEVTSSEEHGENKKYVKEEVERKIHKLLLILTHIAIFVLETDLWLCWACTCTSRCRPRAPSWAAGDTFFHQSASCSWATPAGSVSHRRASPRRCLSVQWRDTQTKLSPRPWLWCPWLGGWRRGPAQLVELGANKGQSLRSVVRGHLNSGVGAS